MDVNARKYLAILWIGVLCLGGISCRWYGVRGLRDGDLLFVTATKDSLSGAISQVTRNKNLRSFEHVGIVKKASTATYVLHATPERGSHKECLDSLVRSAHEGGQRIWVYRLKLPFRGAIPPALQQAERMLGKPYNFSYVLSEEAYYCSDFVQRAFRSFAIFPLQPMSFIDPTTGKTHVFWEHFYKEKGINVPEGEPGCNPNGLASSEKLTQIRELR